MHRRNTTRLKYTEIHNRTWTDVSSSSERTNERHIPDADGRKATVQALTRRNGKTSSTFPRSKKKKKERKDLVFRLEGRVSAGKNSQKRRCTLGVCPRWDMLDNGRRRGRSL